MSLPTEHRLIIDLASIREIYYKYEIANISLIAGIDNPADTLTKPNFGIALTKIISTGMDNTELSQWIFRKFREKKFSFGKRPVKKV